MKFSYYFQLFNFLYCFDLAYAGGGGGHKWHDQMACLRDADASLLVDVIVSLSHSFDPAYVTPFFAEDFTLQSDSLNWINGLPSGATSFDNKDELISAAYNFTTTYPELNPPVTMSFILHDCTDIAYRSVTVETIPVQGTHIIRTRYEHGMWKIYLSYDEFNTAADLASLGVNCKLPPTAT